MAAYIIADVTVTDPAAMEEYRKHVPATLAPFGGRFIVRGGAHQTVEGDWRPNRLVILEFPTVERAREWWSCADYAPAKDIRHAAASTEMILVEGL